MYTAKHHVHVGERAEHAVPEVGWQTCKRGCLANPLAPLQDDLLGQDRRWRYTESRLETPPHLVCYSVPSSMSRMTLSPGGAAPMLQYSGALASLAPGVAEASASYDALGCSTLANQAAPCSFSSFSAWQQQRPSSSSSFATLLPPNATGGALPLPPSSFPAIGPYDIIQLKVTSLHAIRGQREAARIIAVAAGENLHNIYRVIMTALSQREDRARLVFHAWVLPDGSVYGNGTRGARETDTSSAAMGSDREIYFNQLPIFIGYQLELVFGKCVYHIAVQDLFLGLTDEQDLIWTPRVCEGSYGEAVPFDLCYSPHLFRSRLPAREPACKQLADPSVVKSEAEDRLSLSPGSRSADSQLQESRIADDAGNEDSCDSPRSPGAQRLSQLRPVHTKNLYLSADELDDINKNLARMRFIRQYSQIKPLLRKNRPEDYIPDEDKRRQCFRMPIRQFFWVLWSRCGLDQAPAHAVAAGGAPPAAAMVDANSVGLQQALAAAQPAAVLPSGEERERLPFPHPYAASVEGNGGDPHLAAEPDSMPSEGGLSSHPVQLMEPLESVARRTREEDGADPQPPSSMQPLDRPVGTLPRKPHPQTAATGDSAAAEPGYKTPNSANDDGELRASPLQGVTLPARDYIYPQYHVPLVMLGDSGVRRSSEITFNQFAHYAAQTNMGVLHSGRSLYPRCRVSKRYTAPPPEEQKLLDSCVSAFDVDFQKPDKRNCAADQQAAGFKRSVGARKSL